MGKRGKGDASVSPFYWGLRKNKGKREMENQSVEVDFSTSISYIEKKWKGKKERSICWSCSDARRYRWEQLSANWGFDVHLFPI